RLDTFWTVCTSCKVQYEYLRKHVNKRLSCKNCRGAFISVDTRSAPVSASLQYAPSSHTTCNGYGAHGYDAVSRMPTNSTYFLGQYLAHGYEYVTNEGRRKRNVGLGSSGNGFVENITKSNVESKATNLDAKIEHEFKHPGQSYGSMRRWSSATGLDTQKLLINKAKIDIKQRLEIMNVTPLFQEYGGACGENSTVKRAWTGVVLGWVTFWKVIVGTVLASEAAAAATEDVTPLDEVSAPYKVGDDISRIEQNVSSGHPPTPTSMTLIKTDQRSALRLGKYGQFKMKMMVCCAYIAWSGNSKTDIEFGTMKWVQYGFTKSCGHFRIRNTDIIDYVNIFSHLLKGKKTGSDIWDVYKNWSPNWNNSTLDEVRHQYEMVEILDEYSEQFGVCIAPLVKVEGYKTVYCRRDTEESKKWIQGERCCGFRIQCHLGFLKKKLVVCPETIGTWTQLLYQKSCFTTLLP
ncbi:hypothetical protein ARALYDRAFT_493634, partial [Arabidopsis lyrata subsp. lyrata]